MQFLSHFVCFFLVLSFSSTNPLVFFGGGHFHTNADLLYFHFRLTFVHRKEIRVKLDDNSSNDHTVLLIGLLILGTGTR